MRILFATTVLPGGRMGGGEVWSQNIIDGLRAAGAHVTVLGYDRRGVGPGPDEASAGRLTVETSRAPFSAVRWGLRALDAGRPYTVEKWVSDRYLDRLKATLATARFDLVILDHAGLAWLMDHIGDLPMVHVAHQAEAPMYARQAQSRGPFEVIYRREAALVARVEAALARRALAVWTLSEDDRQYFEELRANSVRVLPLAGQPGGARDAAQPGAAEVSLLGSWTWRPNREGLGWFLREVRPLLPADWKIEVAGKRPSPRLPAMRNVRFLGIVPNAGDYLRRARRIAVPAISRVGAPIKILDAIGSGAPVVTTPIAVRDLDNLPPHVAIASAPSDFARALIEAGAGDHALADRWSSARWRRLEAGIASGLNALKDASAQTASATRRDALA